jgi:hypothetical protein
LHVRFTKFCIATYAIRNIYANSEAECGYSDAEYSAIIRTVAAASHVLDWALSLSPVSKDRLRYLGDFGFATLSFCAFFVLQAVQAFRSANLDVDELLDTVEDISLLMTELAMDQKHTPAVYGKSLLLLLAKIRDPDARQNDDDVAGSQDFAVSNAISRKGLLSATRGLSGNEPSTFATFIGGQTWDFIALFPDLLRT